MDNPLVSVIIPCYNAERYISETIESVISQSYLNWEMLVVDDSSSDGSASIIKKYAETDERIKYFKTTRPSGSPAIPRNIGIENSKGEYIAFLDSDDLWLPGKLESQMRFVNEKHAVFVYSDCSRFSSKENIGGIVRTPSMANYSRIKKWGYIPVLTILLKKEILQGLVFETRPQEDFVFLLRLFKQGIVAYNTKECVALYRVLQNSRSRKKLTMLKEHYLILKEFGNSSIVSFIFTITHALSAFCAYSIAKIKR